MVNAYRGLFPHLDDGSLDDLARFVMAVADGLLIAAEVDGLDLRYHFERLAVAVIALAEAARLP
jgi:hypothetical protein